MVLSILCPRYFRDFRNFRDLEIGFPEFEMVLIPFRNAEIKVTEIAEITENLGNSSGKKLVKYHFRLR